MIGAAPSAAIRRMGCIRSGLGCEDTFWAGGVVPGVPAPLGPCLVLA
jgi:hypothetical protein